MQEDVGPGERELQPRVRLHRSRGQFADQTDHGGHLRLLEQVTAVALDELHRPLLIARRKRVIDRLPDQSVLGEPPRRDAVELDDPLGPVTLEPVPQELDEQVVIAEPLVVDPLQEQVALLDLLEHRLPVLPRRTARTPAHRRFAR